MRARVAGLGVLLVVATASQAITVEEIVRRSKQATAGLKDFSCLLTFQVRATSARVPDSRVRLYYKAPDKFKPVPLGDDFTVLPRTYNLALGSVVERMMKDNRAVVLEPQRIDDRPMHVLKLIPKEAVDGLQYNLLFLDAETFLVRRMRTYRTEGAPITIDVTHQRISGLWMPTRVSVQGEEKTNVDGQERLERFTVSMVFSDYNVNQGLDDAIFEDEQPRR